MNGSVWTKISKVYQKEQLDTSLGVILRSLKLPLLRILKSGVQHGPYADARELFMSVTMTGKDSPCEHFEMSLMHFFFKKKLAFD